MRKVLKQLYIKARNRRVALEVIEENKEFFVYILTKRLVDFKKREVVLKQGSYSLETAALLTKGLEDLMSDSKLKAHIDKTKVNRVVIDAKCTIYRHKDIQ